LDVHIPKLETALGPQNHGKMKVFNTQNMGEITPKNEGYGFPWCTVKKKMEHIIGSIEWHTFIPKWISFDLFI